MKEDLSAAIRDAERLEEQKIEKQEECDSCAWDDLPLHKECGCCENCCTCRPTTSYRREKTRRTSKGWKS